MLQIMAAAIDVATGRDAFASIPSARALREAEQVADLLAAERERAAEAAFDAARARRAQAEALAATARRLEAERARKQFKSELKSAARAAAAEAEKAPRRRAPLFFRRRLLRLSFGAKAA